MPGLHGLASVSECDKAEESGMASKSLSAFITSTLVLLTVGVSSASAQDGFAGSWRVVEAVRPDWIEPTSPEPVDPLSIGSIITFNGDSVAAPGYFGCEKATFERQMLSSEELFQGGVIDPGLIAGFRGRFGLGDRTTSLHVECELASFDYHMGSKGLVVQFDNLVYVLARAK